MDIIKSNQEFGHAEPLKVIEWALEFAKNPIVSTNFRPHEAVILHLVTQVKPDIKVLWADSGYNTPKTYMIAEQIIEKLKLNIEVYTPTMTAARWDSAHGGIPETEEARHEIFTHHFKLEPFLRAMQEIKPDVWFTAVRSEQTAFRQGMEVFGTGPNDVIKVAPLLHWKEADMQQYLEQYGLPSIEEENYFDPTKGPLHRECGLHSKL